MRYTNGTDILTQSDIKAQFPNTAFPASGITEDWLNDNGLYPIISTQRPEASADEVVYEDGIEEVEGEWRVKWSVRVMTADEIEKRNTSIISSLQNYRDEVIQNQEITLSNGAVLKVNDRTRRDIADVVDGMLAAGIESYDGWNAVNDRYTMTIADFQEAKVKGLQTVAQVFGAYNSVIDVNAQSPYASFGDAKSAFDNELKKG